MNERLQQSHIDFEPLRKLVKEPYPASSEKIKSVIQSTMNTLSRTADEIESELEQNNHKKRIQPTHTRLSSIHKPCLTTISHRSVL